MPKTKASFCVIAATLCTVIVLFVLPITPKIPVSIAVIERGSLIRSQSMEGLVGYANEQPCLSPLAGQVAQVYVRQGQAVQKGELLARLDTSIEERALSELRQAFHHQEETARQLWAHSEAAQAVWLQNQLSMEQKMQELTLAIEAKTLRAPVDGVLGQIYTGENDYVDAFSPMMTLHGAALEIRAGQRFQDSANLRVGMRAMILAGGAQQAVGTLKGFDIPSVDSATGLYSQTLRFSVEEGQAWLAERLGETVALEVLWDVEPDMALVPIAAVSQNNQLWLVKDGKANATLIDPRKRDADYVCVPEEFIGETVILLPDELPLHQGCLVKEAEE
jgi:membrane fusion protein (multidrug efflux system)